MTEICIYRQVDSLGCLLFISSSQEAKYLTHYFNSPSKGVYNNCAMTEYLLKEHLQHR